MDAIERRRLTYGGAGLALVGAGISIASDAGARRAKGERWFGRGTFGLCLLGAGLSVFGEAVAARAVQLQRERSL